MAELVKVVSPDLRRMRNDLRKLDSILPREITRSLKQAGEDILLPRARREAPVGNRADYYGRRRPAPGRLRDSVRILASQKRVAIAAGYKRLPYALPVHWGWPGHNIAPNRFLIRAADSQAREMFAERSARELDITFRRKIGWGLA